MTPLEEFAAQAGGPVLVLRDGDAAPVPAVLEEQGHVVCPVSQARRARRPGVGGRGARRHRPHRAEGGGRVVACRWVPTPTVACLLTDDRPAARPGATAPGGPPSPGSGRVVWPTGGFLDRRAPRRPESRPRSCSASWRGSACRAAPRSSPPMAMPVPSTSACSTRSASTRTPTSGPRCCARRPPGEVRLDGVDGRVPTPSGPGARVPGPWQRCAGTAAYASSTSPPRPCSRGQSPGWRWPGSRCVVDLLAEASRARLAPALERRSRRRGRPRRPAATRGAQRPAPAGGTPRPRGPATGSPAAASCCAPGVRSSSTSRCGRWHGSGRPTSRWWSSDTDSHRTRPESETSSTAARPRS